MITNTTRNGRTATLTVAADDSSNLSKSQADYVCNGTNDHVQFQAALDDLPTDGGKISLLEGKYHVGAKTTVDIDNVVIDGYSAVIYQDSGSANNGILETFASNIKIKGLTIDGNKNGNPVEIHAIGLYCDGVDRSNISITDCYIFNSDGDGIETGYGNISNIIIGNNVIHDNREHDIHINGGTNVLIQNNITYNELTGGSIVLDGTTTNGGTIEDVLITGNRIYNSSNNGIKIGKGWGAGDHLRPQRTIVSNNNISSCANHGIYIGEYSDKASIINNITELNTYSGIYVGLGSTYSTIANNTISENKSTAGSNYSALELRAHNTIINSNKFYKNDKIGIYARGVNNCQIINNYIYGCSKHTDDTWSSIYGWIDDSTGDSSNNVVLNNIIFCDGSNQQKSAIDITGGGSAYYRTWIIKGNKIWGYRTSCFNFGHVANSTIVRENDGYITESSGTATLVNGQTHIDVTHNLSVTPSVGDIIVTPIELWGNMTQFYINTYTSTQFRINADINPGQDVDFAWKAIVL